MTLEEVVLSYIAAHPGAGREEIRRFAAPEASATTIWRALRRLVDQNQLTVTGRGRATRYSLAGTAVVRAHLRIPYTRRSPVGYKKEFIDRYIPNRTFYLTQADRARLHEHGTPVGEPVPAATYARRILERLLIDLSWASSRMEGNTYNILETERLVRFGEEVAGKDRREAVMILNHKEAIQYVVEHLDEITISTVDIRNIHALLSDGLLIDPAMAGRVRRMPVNIGASTYRPLEDPIQIEEEFEVLVAKAAQIEDPFEQSFFLLVHIPYLQAFEDVNKRTSRIASNIPLLKAGFAPMSFLTMDDRDYIDGLIGIYELNNVSLLRDAYLDAYMASAQNYKALRAEVEMPHKAALVYRDFVRDLVRRAVLDWKAFHVEEAIALAAQAGIPAEERQATVEYARAEFEGLHEGNIVRYRLVAKDLVALRGRQ